MIILASSLLDGAHLTLDPDQDTLLYDTASAQAANLRFITGGPDLGLVLLGKTFWLDGLSLANLSVQGTGLQTATIAFMDSLLVTGDGTALGYSDSYGQVIDLSASTGNNHLIGLGGGDLLIGGHGDDWLVGGSAKGGLVHVSQMDGIGAPTGSFRPGITADGRYVCFSGGWTQFGSADNNAQDIIVKDLATGQASNEHLSATGAFGLSGSSGGQISADGSVVVFASTSGLIPQFPLFQTVYASDPGSLAIEGVSEIGGVFGNGASFNPDLSADGQFVVFGSRATNFAGGGNSTVTDLFVKDRQTETMERVTTSLTGGDANDDCIGARISADGRYVVFASAATNLTATRTGTGKTDIYLWDNVSNGLLNVTGAAGGSDSSNNPDVAYDGGIGGIVVFETNKALVAADTNLQTDVYAYDIATAGFELISARRDGSGVTGGGQDAAVSGDGRYVVFRSFADNLVPGDSNGFADIFVKDRQTGAIALVSAPSGGQADQHGSSAPNISLGGEWIVFESSAGNLVATDANGGGADIFRVANPLLRAQLSGGAGDDTYVLAANDLVVEQAGGGIDTVRASFGYKLGANLENLVLTGGRNVAGRGNGLNNVITGNGGDNLIDGLAGIDTASYASAAAAVTVRLLLTGAQATGAGSDTLANIENLTGSRFNDQLTGDAGSNVLDGGAGNDALNGGAGSDIYYTDSSADVIVDVVADPGIDLVFAGVNWVLQAALENLTLTGTTATNGGGNSKANILIGNGIANTLDGFGGNDTIFGGGGNDSLRGGFGNDALNGGIGNDTMDGGDGSDSYYCNSDADSITEPVANTGIDTVHTGVTWTLQAAMENLTLLGISPLNGSGNSFRNVITGNGGSNVLRGAGGNDTLKGGGGQDILRGDSGDDSLTGGGGADEFRFDSLTGSDVVSDFGSGSDRVGIGRSALPVGNGDLVVDGGVMITGPGGFAATAELVILTTSLASLSPSAAAAGLGSASTAYGLNQQAVFAVDDGVSSAVYLFKSAGPDAGVSAAELTLLGTLSGAASTHLADYLFG